MKLLKTKYCKKCSNNTKHRLVKDSRPNKSNYYSCAICLKNSSSKHRKKYWYRYLAQKANARHLPGSEKITEDMLLGLVYRQKMRCALTNEILDVESKWWKPSLDRIDSNKGYTIENIRLVAWIVNHSRGELTDKEFIDMCNKVSLYKGWA